DADVRLAVYHQLQSSEWPMSKLVSDLACNTPEAVDVEQIRVTYGQPITISGKAKPDDKGHSAQEVVTLMQDNLRKSGLFQEIQINWGDADTFGHYGFQLTARVVNPYRPHEYPRELDYGAWTLSDRLWPQAKAAAPPAPAPPPAEPPKAHGENED